jgi:hypothetical protein
MPNAKLSAWPASTTPTADTDVFATVENMGGTPAHKRKTIRAILNGGWTPAAGTWAYASATTITVPSGAASIYSIGQKWKLTSNGVVLYGYITNVADTLLTVLGNPLTNYTFTANYYSTAANPTGFPQNFAYVPTGVSATNVTMAGRYQITGRRCYCDILISFTGAITFTTMPTLPTPASANQLYSAAVFGSAICGYYDASAGAFPSGLMAGILQNATVVSIGKSSDATAMSATVPITWANGDAVYLHFDYEDRKSTRLNSSH